MVSVRAEVIPVTRAVAEALIAGDDVVTDRYGVSVAPGYLDVPDLLPSVRDALAAGTPPRWFGHLIVDRATLTVVGFGGFKGPPSDGEVEIGYSVAPGWQARGFATAAVAHWVARARAGGVLRVTAHTMAQRSVSTHLLERAGFVRTEVLVDEEIGDVWRFELRLDG